MSSLASSEYLLIFTSREERKTSENRSVEGRSEGRSEGHHNHIDTTTESKRAAIGGVPGIIPIDPKKRLPPVAVHLILSKSGHLFPTLGRTHNAEDMQEAFLELDDYTIVLLIGAECP